VGAIRRQGSAPNRVEYLYQNHTIGRAASCQLVLDRPVISGHHATIRWSEGKWTVRDLGSRNGTFLNGRRLAGGVADWPQELAKGDLILFAGEDEAWELIDASEPKPLLIPLESDLPAIELDDQDVLALPSADEPLVVIYQRQGYWQLERDGDCSLLEDRQEIVVAERRYRLMVTGALEATVEAESKLVRRRVEDMILDIKVSRDEEEASVAARMGDEVHELPSRTYLYLLAFLARRRCEEAATRGPDAGWVDVDTACRELSLASPEALALLVYRCRKAIKDSGVEDPAAIIDRSRRRQVRIGVGAEQLSVAYLD
jgi:hypothetical protein